MNSVQVMSLNEKVFLKIRVYEQSVSKKMAT